MKLEFLYHGYHKRYYQELDELREKLLRFDVVASIEEEVSLEGIDNDGRGIIGHLRHMCGSEDVLSKGYPTKAGLLMVDECPMCPYTRMFGNLPRPDQLSYSFIVPKKHNQMLQLIDELMDVTHFAAGKLIYDHYFQRGDEVRSVLYMIVLLVNAISKHYHVPVHQIYYGIALDRPLKRGVVNAVYSETFDAKLNFFKLYPAKLLGKMLPGEILRSDNISTLGNLGWVSKSTFPQK